MGWKFLIIFFVTQIVFSQPLNLADLIDSAFTNNPEIKAIKAKYEAGLTKTPLLQYLPDPLLGVEISGEMTMYSITQEIPFPTKMHSQSRYARSEAEEFLNEYYALANKIEKQVKEYYSKFYLIQMELNLMEESKRILEQIIISARTNYQLKRVPQADVIHSQIALLKLENHISELENERAIVISELNRLINHPVDSELNIDLDLEVEPLGIDLDSLYKLARANNPVLKSYISREKKAEAGFSLSKQEYLPDFMLKYEFGGMDFKDYKIMFGLTAPLWFWQKQRNMVLKMRQELTRVQAEYEAMENEVMKIVRELKLMIENYERKTKLYENVVIPQLELALQSTMRAYELNKTEIMSVLDTQRMLIEEKLEYQRTRLALFISISDLDNIIYIRSYY